MDVHERLQEVFESVFGYGEVELTDEMTAEDVPRWDSVAHISLMVSIEQPVILHIGLAIIERTPDRLMREIGARLGSLAGERGEAGNRQHGFQSRHDELSHK